MWSILHFFLYLFVSRFICLLSFLSKTATPINLELCFILQLQMVASPPPLPLLCLLFLLHVPLTYVIENVIKRRANKMTAAAVAAAKRYWNWNENENWNWMRRRETETNQRQQQETIERQLKRCGSESKSKSKTHVEYHRVRRCVYVIFVLTIAWHLFSAPIYEAHNCVCTVCWIYIQLAAFCVAPRLFLPLLLHRQLWVVLVLCPLGLKGLTARQLCAYLLRPSMCLPRLKSPVCCCSLQSWVALSSVYLSCPPPFACLC